MDALLPSDSSQGESFSQVEILQAREFYSELLDVIPGAERRVLGTTMALSPDEVTWPIIDAMTDKSEADESVRVVLQADGMSYLTSPGSMPVWWPSRAANERRNDRSDTIQDVQAALIASGGEFVWLKSTGAIKKLFPLWDVNHIKAFIIDDTCYLSGPNLGAKDLTTTTDAVIKIKNKQLADDLERALFSGGDMEGGFPIGLGDAGTVIIDDGTARRSPINVVVEDIIASEATEVLIAGKMLPAGGVRRALTIANGNGADIDYVCRSRSRQNAIQRVRDKLVKACRPVAPYVRVQTEAEIDRVGSIHAYMIVTSSFFVATTSVFSRFCERAHMQDIAFVSQHPEVVRRGRRLFAELFPREEVIEGVS